MENDHLTHPLKGVLDELDRLGSEQLWKGQAAADAFDEVQKAQSHLRKALIRLHS